MGEVIHSASCPIHSSLNHFQLADIFSSEFFQLTLDFFELLITVTSLALGRRMFDFCEIKGTSFNSELMLLVLVYPPLSVASIMIGTHKNLKVQARVLLSTNK